MTDGHGRTSQSAGRCARAVTRVVTRWEGGLAVAGAFPFDRFTFGRAVVTARHACPEERS
ncbi:hypothetical protein [Streptosporangium sp. KLBMP 9127]|nr:hypothetical protein [Streptosporangium sp. KLBMP 9127]